MGTSDIDVEMLVGEFRQIRTDFAKITALLEQTVRHVGAEAAQRALATGEQVWAETQDAADRVNRKIKDQPLAAAGAAFGIGVLIGLLFSSRR